MKHIFVFACFDFKLRYQGRYSSWFGRERLLSSLKKWWLIWMMTCARMTTLEKSEHRMTLCRMGGSLLLQQKIFLVNLILVPHDHKSEQLCICIPVWCSEPKTSFKGLECFETFFFITLWTVLLHCYTRETGKKSRVQPAGTTPSPNTHNCNFILRLPPCSWKPFESLQQLLSGRWGLPPIYRWSDLSSVSLKNLGAITGSAKVADAEP